MSKFLWLRIVIVSCGCGFWPTAALSQPIPRLRFQESVSIRVDNEATKALLTIEDRWAAGRWSDALDDLISLTESRPAAIVQVDWGEDAGVSRYQPVAAAAERWLATLSAEGLQRYRQRIDPAANQLWETWQQTRDPSILEQITQRYFYSRSANAAIWELGHTAWGQGDLAAARQWWAALLPSDVTLLRGPSRRYPDPRQPVAEIAARLVLCDLLSSSPDGSAELASYRQKFSTTPGTLGGRDGLWFDLLTAAAAADRPELAGAVDVPTFAGAVDRGKLSTGMLDLGGELWSIPLPTAVVPRSPMPLLHPQAPPLAYFPAVVDDIVYINDGSRIFAWNLYSGTPVWDPQATGSAMIYPPLSPDPPLAPRRPVRGSPLWSVTVGNGRLYASLGSVVTTPAPVELREQASELVCLDVAAGEGRLLWTLPSPEISARVQSDDPDAPPWMWEGTPLLLGTRLYGAMSRRRPQLEWSVVCLDAETGQLLWHRPVGMSRPTPPDHENLASHLLLSAGHGCLYLSTNWGAIVALDARNGDLRWAVSYESQPRTNSWRRAWADAAPPCLVTSKYVYVAPTDSWTVMCLDAQSGQLVWQRPESLELGPVDEPVEHLLGVNGGCLIAAGASLWGLDAETGAVRWSLRPGDPELQGYGRGWISRDAVYWPSQTAIQIVHPQTGVLLREHPLLTPDVRRMGGHLVQVGGVLLIAGHDRLTAYGAYARLRESTERQLSQHPEDHRSRLRLAELAVLRSDLTTSREQWGAVSRELDSCWAQRASARWLTSTLQSSGQRGTHSRQGFAEVRKLALAPRHVERTLALEVERATDADWRIDALHRWVQHQARSPPAAGAALTRSFGEVLLQELRHNHGPTAFVRFDAAAKECLDQLGADADSASFSSIQRDFPTSPFAWAERTSLEAQPVDGHLSEGKSSAANTSGYWKIAWRRPLPPASSVVIPALAGSKQEGGSLLITTDGVSAWDRASGQTTGRLPVTSIPQWATCADGVLLVATPDELLSISLPEGRLGWRVPCHTDGSSRSRQWWLTRDCLICCDPQAEIVATDVATGEVRWRSDLATFPWTSQVNLSEDWIIGQQAGTSQVVVLSTRDGQRSVSFPATGRPWLRRPVVSVVTDQIVLVDDQRAITAWSFAGEPRWSLNDAVSSAHADPWICSWNDRWYAILDALRLTEIRASGWSGASLPLSSVPIRNVAESVHVVDGVLIVCSPMRLTGIDLETMSVAWQVDRVFEKTQRIMSAPGSKEFMHLMRPPNDGQPQTLEIREVRTGRLQQSLSLPGPHDVETDVELDGSGLLVKTSNALLRLQRPQSLE